MKELILGVNGFIGSHLSERILQGTDWEVYGKDLGFDKIAHIPPSSRFHYVEGDISINREWVEYHIKKCDVVLPLVAIATPKTYIENPLGVFELDFEENLRIIRQCVKYRRRVVFPSTSEVYGMCGDKDFDEYGSHLVMGPVNKQRWIYACSKQLLDRVIWAYGSRGELDFTLIRPFNWIGPRLDSLETAKEGSSRVVTQFIASLVYQEPIVLVDGGRQRRSFTYITDGINALMSILFNKDKAASGKIFNIGNPANNCSIEELARKLLTMFKQHPSHRNDKVYSPIIIKGSGEFYGDGYQDIYNRVPSILNAKKALGWEPTVGLDEALRRTLDSFLSEMDNHRAAACA
ncbi:MAG TPA: bifunctional UDP-4-keto-pentose/UDP-xylose synthase [Deltaproteobacteria bacterium]|nr:bifunctional UDP-4-keto-pentose/UDP-xylose synthase [Deltaproteobacteria bacterium]HPP81196.1 bifunctional UDP-4-keto-pentose/UDP-xylose synthase [Deltaproteobacteria bacterium]